MDALSTVKKVSRQVYQKTSNVDLEHKVDICIVYRHWHMSPVEFLLVGALPISDVVQIVMQYSIYNSFVRKSLFSFVRWRNDNNGWSLTEYGWMGQDEVFHHASATQIAHREALHHEGPNKLLENIESEIESEIINPLTSELPHGYWNIWSWCPESFRNYSDVIELEYWKVTDTLPVFDRILRDHTDDKIWLCDHLDLHLLALIYSKWLMLFMSPEKRAQSKYAYNYTHNCIYYNTYDVMKYLDGNERHHVTKPRVTLVVLVRALLITGWTDKKSILFNTLVNIGIRHQVNDTTTENQIDYTRIIENQLFEIFHICRNPNTGLVDFQCYCPDFAGFMHDKECRFQVYCNPVSGFADFRCSCTKLSTATHITGCNVSIIHMFISAIVSRLKHV